jgi:AcrR family transcriptional regulator
MSDSSPKRVPRACASARNRSSAIGSSTPQRGLFEQKGFEAATVDEICARADVSQKTFFNYFPTKHHVVREIADAFLEEVGAYVEEARKLSGSTVERLVHLFHRAGEEAVAAGRGTRSC